MHIENQGMAACPLVVLPRSSVHLIHFAIGRLVYFRPSTLATPSAQSQRYSSLLQLQYSKPLRNGSSRHIHLDSTCEQSKIHFVTIRSIAVRVVVQRTQVVHFRICCRNVSVGILDALRSPRMESRCPRIPAKDHRDCDKSVPRRNFLPTHGRARVHRTPW